MAYQVSVRIATGSEQPTILRDMGNYTDNVEEMWDTALTPTTLRGLHNMVCSSAAPLLATAINSMRSSPATYRSLRGTGSLGDYEGALLYLVRLHEACLEYPLATVHVTRRIT